MNEVEKCRKYPELCKSKINSSGILTDFNTPFNDFLASDALQVPVRRFGVRELPLGEKHKAHHTVEEQEDGTFTLKPPERVKEPEELVKLRKKTNKKVNEIKRNFQKKLDIGQRDVIEDMDSHRYARLSDLSYRHSYKDKKGFKNVFEEGSKYIPNFENYVHDKELSGRQASVFENTETGDVVIAWRGSDTEFFNPETLLKDPSRAKNIEDWITNGAMLIGKHRDVPEYKKADDLVQRVAEKYGKAPSEMKFTGHSRAGLIARTMAEKYGAEAHVFNSASTPLLQLSYPEVHPEAKVRIDRLYGDVVSAGHQCRDKGPHIEVKNTTSIAGLETKVLDQHGIEQFYTDNPEVINESQVKVKRTTPVRNFLGLTSGELTGYGKNLLYSELLMPTYEKREENVKQQAFIVPDIAKGTLFPGFLDSPSFAFDFIETQGMGLLPEEKVWLRHHIFGKKDAPPPEVKKSPEIVRWLAKLTGRAAEDEELQLRYDVERGIYEREKAKREGTFQPRANIAPTGDQVERYTDPDTGKTYVLVEDSSL